VIRVSRDDGDRNAGDWWGRAADPRSLAADSESTIIDLDQTPPRMDRAALRKLLRRNRIEWVRREYPDIGICHYTSWLRRHVPPDAWAEARPTGIHIFTTAGLVAVAVPIRRTTHTFTHPDGRTMTENRYEDTELSES